VGENGFSSLYHEGRDHSLHLSVVAEKVILMIVFDERSSVGLVRLRVQQHTPELASVVGEVLARTSARAPGSPAHPLIVARSRTRTSRRCSREPVSMTFINYAAREINCKVVYYGPGLGGKTTNLQWIHEKSRPDAKGKLVSLATETERTLFFDFLPIELGTVRGFGRGSTSTRSRVRCSTTPRAS